MLRACRFDGGGVAPGGGGGRWSPFFKTSPPPLGVGLSCQAISRTTGHQRGRSGTKKNKHEHGIFGISELSGVIKVIVLPPF